MRQENLLRMIAILFITTIIFSINSAKAQKTPAETITLKVQDGKLAPVAFPHGVHAKAINCVVCHHKDKDPRTPEKCRTCHLTKKVKEKAPPIQDAFHTKCQTCHIEAKPKGASAPTKCNDCHKK